MLVDAEEAAVSPEGLKVYDAVFTPVRTTQHESNRPLEQPILGQFQQRGDAVSGHLGFARFRGDVAAGPAIRQVEVGDTASFMGGGQFLKFLGSDWSDRIVHIFEVEAAPDRNHDLFAHAPILSQAAA